MEMAAHEGQRCEKATGKISFLDFPHNTLQPHTSCASQRAAVIQQVCARACVCVLIYADVPK